MYMKSIEDNKEISPSTLCLLIVCDWLGRIAAMIMIIQHIINPIFSTMSNRYVIGIPSFPIPTFAIRLIW